MHFWYFCYYYFIFVTVILFFSSYILLFVIQIYSLRFCISGEVWHLHQLVLSASSSHFAQLLRLTPPGKTPILILDGPPASDVNALIHFIYHGEVNVDQDSLPSLLRTAASLRIKGLADVTGLTQDINPETFPTDDDIPNLSASLTSCGVALSSNGTEEMSPLNLSCHKNLESKEEENFSRCLLPPVEEKPISEPPDPFLLPPSKRARTHESQQRPLIGNVIPQSESQTRATETNYIPVTVSQINCMNNNSTMTDNFVPSFNKEPSAPKFISPQKPATETVRIVPSNGSTNFYSTSGNASFPLLNMALAPPHVAYQQSSTTQENLEIKHSENNSVSSFVQTVPNLCEKPQGSDMFSCKTAVVKSADDTCTIQEKIHHSPHDTMQLSPHNRPVSSMEVCSSSPNNSEKRKNEIENLAPSFAVSSPEIGDSFPLQVEEKTFNHKKFSPCVIPNSNVNAKKTVQVISGVYTSKPTSTPFVIKKDTTKESFTSNSETHVSTISPEILIQSPSIVKLTPVTVTNYSPGLTVANSFPANSIIYTASGTALPPCENSVVTTPVCPIISNSKANIITVDEKVTSLVSPQNSPPEASESSENGTFSSVSYPVTSTAHSTEGSTPSTQQRVTINMRTFKV